MAPGVAPLSYAGLVEVIDRTVASLRALGLGRSARVATVLPNGPELAVATVAISAAATCVPMNPNARPAELESYLKATRSDAVIVRSDQPTGAREVARSL